MEVNTNMVNYLAHLARLQFTEAETADYTKDLEKMIAFVEQLQQVDTTGVEPLLHMTAEINVMRPDVVEGSVSRQAALLNSPTKDETYFKVPTVIKK
jgi:aspartyl-tRNA(Asn)/glutamyl-tRNA(Gln) amidotransferase subunit C